MISPFALYAAPLATLTPRNCNQVLGVQAVSRETALRFLNEVVEGPLIAFAQRLNANSSDFRQWQTRQQVKWMALTDFGKFDALADYYALKLEDIEPSHTAREDRLGEELRHRGVKGTGSGYAMLEEVSRDNYQNLLREFKRRIQFKSVEYSLPPAVLEQLARIELAYFHNTRGLDRLPAWPLLSSRELIRLGIGGKLSAGNFNQNILGSGNNVFFFAIPYVNNGPFPKSPLQYGDVNLLLNKEFAEQSGWMSPYVMYPKDLAALGRQALNYEVQGSAQHVDKIPDEQWRPLVQKLHRFDLKPQHYIQLLRETLRLSLIQLGDSDRAEYDRVVQQLVTGQGLTRLIEQYSLGVLGVPFGSSDMNLELKVPVRVPLNALRLRLEPASERPTSSGRSAVGPALRFNWEN